MEIANAKIDLIRRLVEFSYNIIPRTKVVWTLSLILVKQTKKQSSFFFSFVF